MSQIKYIGIIFIGIVFFSCSPTTIDHIDVYFYNYSFEAPMAINSEDIVKGYNSKRKSLKKKRKKGNLYFSELEIIKKSIKNKNTLLKIEQEINDLQKDTSSTQSIDARIVCLIYYKDKNRDKLQLDIGGYLANSIHINGVHQVQNNHLLFHIKKTIGYYSFMDGKDCLQFQDELNDKSIPRDSIKDNLGRYW